MSEEEESEEELERLYEEIRGRRMTRDHQVYANVAGVTGSSLDDRAATKSAIGKVSSDSNGMLSRIADWSGMYGS